MQWSETSAPLSHALSQALAAPSVGKGTFKSHPHLEQEREGYLVLGQMGNVESPGPSLLWVAGCMRNLWAVIPECLGEPLKVLQRSINTGPAARQQQGEEAVGPTVGAKTEPSLFLTVPAVQFIKEL